MQRFLNLKCFNCQKELTQFIILSCNHSLCDHCISFRKKMLQEKTLITCSCGLTTQYLPNNTFTSEKQTSNDTISLLSPSKAIKVEEKTFTNLQNQTNQTINISSIAQINQVKNINSELLNQLNYIDHKFVNYLREIQKSYNHLISKFKQHFKNICDQIKNQCSPFILNSTQLSLSKLSQKINILFTNNIGKKMQKLNKMLNTFPNFATTLKEQKKLRSNKTLNKNNKQNFCHSNTSLKKQNNKIISHRKQQSSGNMFTYFTQAKNNGMKIEELKKDLKQQKKILKKTMIHKKPSQLFQL